MWSLMTYDFQNDIKIVMTSTSEIKITAIIPFIKSKDIICDSMKFIAEEALKKGFEFGEPEECLK